MQRHLRFHNDKHLLALERERNRLHALRRRKVPVDPPREHGWVQHFRLTRSAAGRPDAAILRTILMELDTRRYSNTRHFGPRRRWARSRRMYYTEQSLLTIAPGNWPRLGWPDEWRERYFALREIVWLHHRTAAWVFTGESLFELFSERHFIHEEESLDPDIERRLAEVNLEIGDEGERRLNWLYGRSHRRWSEDPRIRLHARLASRRIRRAMQGDWEAERGRQTHRLLSAFPRSQKYPPA